MYRMSLLCQPVYISSMSDYELSQLLVKQMHPYIALKMDLENIKCS